MIDAICMEINEKKNYLDSETIKTIYFGGGTPSILSLLHLTQIVKSIHDNYKMSKNLEFTFECNPDDLTEQKLINLKTIGVNRLSIGIQSFEDEQLRFMNRAHNANEANQCVHLAQKMGFNNITIDLIYGLPNTNNDYWAIQVQKAVDLNVNHISAYCLTIEDKTVFGSWHKKGKLNPITDEQSLNQFKLLQTKLKNADFDHYEISNFSKNGSISKHNSAYWLGEKYVGIGPSAHSFNGKSRQWNIANNIKYIKALNHKQSYFEIEHLTPKDQFNEYILTRLRTKWGVNLTDLFKVYNKDNTKVTNRINEFIKNGDLSQINQTVFLTEQGKFIADFISAELFV